MTSAWAQAPAFLVKDINAIPRIRSSNPADFTTIGGVTFFPAETVSTGRELWKTDGTASGTSLAVDLYPGPGSSSPEELTAVGGILFFTAYKPTEWALFASDGTPAGTKRLTPLQWNNGQRAYLYPGSDALYFLAWTDGIGARLWKSDGTPEGTAPIALVNASYLPSVSSLAEIGGTAVFAATDAAHGTELWAADGTPDGTRLVADILPGTISSDPTSLVRSGNHVFFAALGDGVGTELWRTDGTQQGTVLVKDIVPGSGSSTPSLLTDVDGKLFFRTGTLSNYRLWVSDGTDAGTMTVTSVALSDISNLTAADGLLFFTSDRSLWRSDGTPAGTYALQATNFPGSPVSPSDLVAANGELFFTAHEALSGFELWTSDGTAAGTFPISSPFPKVYGSSYLTPVGNGLMFRAGDSSTGTELWWSDKTPAGTGMLANISNDEGTGNSRPFSLADNGGTLYFFAEPGTGLQLWRSDGTDAGTLSVTDGCSNCPYLSWPPPPIVASGGLVFFPASDLTHDLELWRSDGTGAGTHIAADIYPGGGGSYPSELTDLNGVLLFSAFDGVTGVEPWRSDGSAAGTWQLADIEPGTAFSDPWNFYTLGANGYFSARTSAEGYELWRTDGTPSGTFLVKDIYPGSGSGTTFSRAQSVGDLVVFVADDGVHGLAIWRSDGTADGTALVRSFDAAATSGEMLGPYAVVRSFTTSTGIEFWRTDGTESGTYLLKDICPGTCSGLTVDDGVFVDGIYYFAANDGTSGEELWRTDGTTSGTFLLKDINPGPADSSPMFLTPIDGHLVFAAIEPDSGMEIWESDGSAPGTRLLADINPGPVSGFTLDGGLVRSGGLIFFSAQRIVDGSKGEELWALPVSSLGRCGNHVLDAGEECDDGGRIDGDGCSAGCRLEGVLPSCDDGDPCTIDSFTSTGCTNEARPRSSCVSGSGGGLRLRRDSTRLGGNRLVWDWTAPKGTSQFTAPFTGPALCVYDGSGVIARVPLPDAGSGWKAKRNGFLYADRNASYSGVKKMRLASGLRTESRIRLRASGARLPSARLPAVGAVTAQMIDDTSGACFGTAFSDAEVRRNDERVLRVVHRAR